MKVTNNSDVDISDEEIKNIVNSNVSIDLIDEASEIIVSEELYITLVVNEGYDMSRELSIGKLTEEMRWGLDDE
jgi:hypothetical protein